MRGIEPLSEGYRTDLGSPTSALHMLFFPALLIVHYERNVGTQRAGLRSV